MTISPACLSCIILAVAAHAHAQTTRPETPVHNIQLTEPRDIADAIGVNSAISVMVNKVASCSPAAARDAQSCACSFTNDLKKLREAYDGAVAKHPGWNADGTVVAYVDPANGKSVTINFPGVKRQLNACAKR